MHILIYGINYTPELIGIGKYTGEMAEWLSSRGHQVRMITAPPYYPDWRVGDGYSAWCYQREVRSGVTVYRCPVWVPRCPTGLKRLLHLISFAASSLPVILCHTFWRPDVVIMIEPPFFCAPGTLLAARLCGAKAWLHIQDFEIDAAFALKFLSFQGLRRWVQIIESWLMRRFDRVSTISERMLDRLSDKGLNPTKCALFLNWVDTRLIYPLRRPSLIRKELGIPGEAVVALYSGNLGQKQGLENLIDMANRCVDHKEIVFVMCGGGTAYSKLRRLAGRLTNIHWLPLQPTERLNELLNLADIHLLPQRADAADLVMPSKLGGMLASGRPVVATATPGSEIYQVITDSGAGILVPPGDIESLTAATLKLAEQLELRKRMGAAARRYAAKHLSKDLILTNFERFIINSSMPN